MRAGRSDETLALHHEAGRGLRDFWLRACRWRHSRSGPSRPPHGAPAVKVAWALRAYGSSAHADAPSLRGTCA